MTRCFCSLLACLVLLSLAPCVPAQTVTPVPTMMNFQGRLAKPDGTPVSDGNYPLTFRIFAAATGGTALWTQTMNPVLVRNGVFSVLLGNGNPLTDTVLNGTPYLEIQVGNNTPLSPRQAFTSVAFALKANTVPDGAITTPKLADGAITSAKLSSSFLSAGGDLTGTYPNPSLTTNGALLPKVSGNLLSTANGMLGINTSNPAFALDVWGNRSAGLAVHYSGGVGAPSINWINDYGQWHFSGPRSGEPYNPLALYWVPYINGNNNFYRLLTVNSLGNMGIGVDNPAVRLDVAGNANISGTMAATELQATGSDVAEPYRIQAAGGVTPVPGMVVVIDPNAPGHLKVAQHAYDATVAGIVSGANGVKPGLVLRQPGTLADGNLPVASSGRVYCWCDADANGPIAPGNLLTTSNTPGHAMRATDKARRDGAVIGKAMTPLKQGKGLVLVLVTLQ